MTRRRDQSAVLTANFTLIHGQQAYRLIQPVK